jgi:hypothetical protein
MFPRGDGTLEVIKSLDMDLFDILDLWEKYQDKELCVHFRFRTRGNKSLQNVQPIRVLSHKYHKRELWMMHNGTINGMVRPNSTKSDSVHFVEDYLRPMLRSNTGLIDQPPFQNILTKMVGTSRVLFMDGDGKVIYLNQFRGYTIGRTWLSNARSISDPWQRDAQNPLTKDEKKEKEKKEKEHSTRIQGETKRVQDQLQYQYDPEMGFWYRSDPKSGEPFYISWVPDTNIREIKPAK